MNAPTLDGPGLETENSTLSRPFEGLRVLELAQGVAAPYCGMMLAQNGADVTKIEPIGYGDWSRGLGRRQGDFSAESIVLSRGKNSIALDLKKPEGRALAFRLASTADVVIENYRPGVIERLGLDYPSVSAANPKVIYASVTGFGPVGPRRNMPATDTVMQGYTGFMSINRDEAGIPRRVNMLAIDVSTGLYMSQAVSAALYRRAVKGVGAHVRTSLLECAMAFQESRIVQHALEGAGVKPVGAPVGTFVTADGYLSLNARRDNHFAALCKLLNQPQWLEDSRFSNEQSRLNHAADLNALVAPLIKQHSTDHWADVLSGADILHAPVYDYGDLMKDEQVRTIQAITWTDIEGLGSVPAARLPGLPPPPARPDLSVPPRVGQQGRKILADAGCTDAEIEQMLASGAVALPD